mmetsp:Transcript_93730/g.268221  ORF Transcript_93730/g.268221 Transcript_93730/m.268221 type:complete len:239 (+) Transcript_93730:993-1709(+)
MGILDATALLQLPAGTTAAPASVTAGSVAAESEVAVESASAASAGATFVAGSVAGTSPFFAGSAAVSPPALTSGPAASVAASTPVPPMPLASSAAVVEFETSFAPSSVPASPSLSSLVPLLRASMAAAPASYGTRCAMRKLCCMGSRIFASLPITGSRQLSALVAGVDGPRDGVSSGGATRSAEPADRVEREDFFFFFNGPMPLPIPAPTLGAGSTSGSSSASSSSMVSMRLSISPTQ